MTPRKPQATPPPSVAPEPAESSFRTWAAAIFAAALAVRLLHTWLLSRSPFFDALLGDAKGYDDWAQRLAAGDWIGTEVFYQAPLYPYFLGVVYKVLGHSLWALRICQSLVGAGSCTLLGLAACRFFGVRAGLFAGFGLAIYAPAVFFDALIQKSVLDLFFITLSLWLISRLVDAPADTRSWVGLGLAMGGMSLTRENALVFVGLILVWALVMPLKGRQKPAPTSDRVRLKPDPTNGGRTAQVRLKADPANEGRTVQATGEGAGFSRPDDVVRAEFSWRNDVVGSGFSRTRHALAFLVGLGIVLMPVAIRNYAVGGGFYLTTSQFGPNFYIGNNPQADGTYASLRFGRGAPEYERTDATELAEHALGRTLTPAEVSSYWTDKALTFITSQPGAWLRLQTRKVVLLFNATEMLDTEAQESHAEWSWPLRAGGWFGHLGVLVPLAFLGLVIGWPDRRRLAILYAMLAIYAASVVMFYVFARYRLPLVPLLLLFAASGLAALPRWFPHADTRTRALVASGVLVLTVFSNWPVLSKAEMMAITETNLAVALQSTGRTAEAAEHYSRAIALQPDYAPAYNNLGVMQRSMGQVDQAIATYERALSLEGTYPDAHYNLANALLEKNRAHEAAEHFRIALQSIPDSAGAANNLGVALANQNRPQDAIAAFRAAVAAEPQSAVAHRNLADALSTAGQIDDAIAEFNRAAALDPMDPATPYNLGIVLIQADRIPEAIAALKTAVTLAPTSVDAHNNLGIAVASSGDLDGAVVQFQRALALDRTSVEARRNLEMALQARAQAGGTRR